MSSTQLKSSNGNPIAPFEPAATPSPVRSAEVGLAAGHLRQTTKVPSQKSMRWGLFAPPTPDNLPFRNHFFHIFCLGTCLYGS
jgi:hypothetical protein